MLEEDLYYYIEGIYFAWEQASTGDLSELGSLACAMHVKRCTRELEHMWEVESMLSSSSSPQKWN